MFRFCRFVRIQILGDEPSPRKVVPMPRSAIYQVGDMILTKVDEIPSNAGPIEIERLPDGSIPWAEGMFSTLEAKRTMKTYNSADIAQSRVSTPSACRTLGISSTESCASSRQGCARISA